MAARTLSLLISMLLLGGTAQAQTDDPAQLATQLRAQLEARQPQSAVDTLARLERTRGSAPTDYEWLFLQGVTWQELAVQGPEAERAQAIVRARQAYLDALRLRPVAPAVFNNLAALSTLSGDERAADDWYRQAIAAGDARSGYYALNYARALEQRDPASALRHAALALKAAPGNDEVAGQVGALASRVADGDAFLRFLADAVVQGRTGLVTSLALQELTAASPRTTIDRGAVLVLLAHALSRDPATLAQPPASALLDGLRRVGPDAGLAGGARQLARVLGGELPGAAELNWWSRERVALLGRSRSAVMLELLMALAQQRAAQRPAEAERLYQVAVALGERGPDPDAFLRLVELYVNRDQSARLKPLMERYEVELFSEKGEAYQRNDLPLIYRMHVALGMTYAYMKVWTSASPFQNATFQLENAGRAAARFNEQARRAGKPERLLMPPAAALQLAEAYSSRGQRDQATRSLLDAAEALAGAQRLADGSELLAAIRPDDLGRLNAAGRDRYRSLSLLLNKP